MRAGLRLGALALLALAAVPVPAAQDQSCDTACLTGLAERFMDALVAQDGSSLPWAARVHYAENSVPMQIGDGVWATASAHAPKPLIVADPVTGKVAWIGSIDEHGQGGFYALELTAQDGAIAAAQTVIRRKEGRPPFGDPHGFAHDPLFSKPVGKEQAMSRDAMLALATRYVEAQAGRGEAPDFGPGCMLVENGVIMSGNRPAATGEAGDCASSFSGKLFGEVEAVRSRILAVDPARGLVVAIGYRDLPAAQTTFSASDGKTYKSEADYPRSLGFVTLLKIAGGQVLRVESIASELPYGMPPPWSEGP